MRKKIIPILFITISLIIAVIKTAMEAVAPANYFYKILRWLLSQKKICLSNKIFFGLEERKNERRAKKSYFKC